MANINLLPPEILALIFQPTYIKELFDPILEPPEIVYSPEPLLHRDAKRICLTCRAWVPHGRAMLYRSVEWTLLSKASMKLVTSLAAFPYLCRFVRCLSLDSGDVCVKKFLALRATGVYEVVGVGPRPPPAYMEEYCQLRLVLGVLQQCMLMEEVTIIGYLSDALMLGKVIQSLPKSLRRISINFYAGIIEEGEYLGTSVWVETGKLLTLLRDQLPRLTTLSLDFGPDSQIDILQEPLFRQLSIRHLSLGPFNSGKRCQNGHTVQILGFFNLSVVTNLTVPMEMSFLTSLISSKDSLTHLTDLTLLPTMAPVGIRSALTSTLSTLLPHVKLETLDIQHTFYRSCGPIDFSQIMYSLPPTLIFLKGLDTANHADSVADFWKTGKCPHLKRIEMRTWSKEEIEASPLQKALSARLRFENGFPDSPEYVGIVNVVPILQELYPRFTELS